MAGCVIVIVLFWSSQAAALYVDWTWKRKLSPRGGRPFLTRVELPVPSFQQGDDKWRDDPLGGVPENGTIGGEGCAVAAAAMVFKFYGIDVDPQQLNWFLTATDGFTEQGWLYWDRAAWFAPDRVRHVYEDLPSYHLIDSNIAHGNPVIVRVRWLAESRILSSSQGKTVSIISCAIPALALRKGFIRCANSAATSRRCDSTSPSPPRIRSCLRAEVHAVGVGGVDAADQRVHQQFLDLVSEPGADQRPHGTVGATAGQQRLERGPCLASPAEQAARRQARRAGRHAEHETLGDRVEVRRAPRGSRSPRSRWPVTSGGRRGRGCAPVHLPTAPGSRRRPLPRPLRAGRRRVRWRSCHRAVRRPRAP